MSVDSASASGLSTRRCAEQPHDDALRRADAADRDRQQQRDQADRHEEQIVRERHVDADAAAEQIGLHDAEQLHGDRERARRCSAPRCPRYCADGVGQRQNRRRSCRGARGRQRRRDRSAHRSATLPGRRRRRSTAAGRRRARSICRPATTAPTIAHHDDREQPEKPVDGDRGDRLAAREVRCERV